MGRNTTSWYVFLKMLYLEAQEVCLPLTVMLAYFVKVLSSFYCIINIFPLQPISNPWEDILKPCKISCSLPRFSIHWLSLLGPIFTVLVAILVPLLVLPPHLPVGTSHSTVKQTKKSPPFLPFYYLLLWIHEFLPFPQWFIIHYYVEDLILSLVDDFRRSVTTLKLCTKFCVV